MSNVLVAVIAILLGVVACFYGYPLVRILFALVGLVVGYQIGIQLVATDQWILAVAIGVIVGLVCALLAYPLWSIGVTISGMLLGYALFTNFGTLLNLGSTGVIIVGIIGAVIMGLLFFIAKDPMIMLATALSGASYMIYGLSLLIPELASPNASLILTVAALALGIFGFLVQYRTFRGRNLYTPSTPAAQPL
jgi:hypothetical protein